MAERFAYTAGTISITNGSSTVTGTDTSWGGHDWAGSQIWAVLASGAAVRVGTVAEVDPRGEYEALELPLVSPYNGTTLSDEDYELVDGAAIASGATQAAIFARYAAFIEGSAGLVFNIGDIADYALVPNNSFVVDVDNDTIYQWRDGVLEPLSAATAATDTFSRAQVIETFFGGL